jgi:ElaB/YqjD/DUF883 family membrane-anchored ribosome-binding protein
MNNLKNQIAQTATAIGEDAKRSAESIQASAEKTWGTVQEQAGQFVRARSEGVRENPVPNLLAALGFGLILGWLLSRRQPESFTDACKRTGRKFGL